VYAAEPGDEGNEEIKFFLSKTGLCKEMYTLKTESLL
jgi:hypothetical protein